MTRAITFCATGRTGLGHLRRVTNVARALAVLPSPLPMDLLTNADCSGLEDDERRVYRTIASCPRDAMAAALASAGCTLAVVDTAVLPGLHRLDARLCLILRETIPEQVARFALDGGRPWDLVLVPNPREHWMPLAGAVPARRIEAVGWIYRSPAQAGPAPGAARSVLVASGGGGSDETAAVFRSRVASLLEAVRARLAAPLEVVQALGPRAPEAAAVPGADRVIRPGAVLHEHFARHDLVISTAGYNSVLELAATDVPALLMPVARTYDDQDKRTREWGQRLGLVHRDDDPRRTVEWISRVLDARARRPPWPLGPSGAARCAGLLAELAG